MKKLSTKTCISEFSFEIMSQLKKEAVLDGHFNFRFLHLLLTVVTIYDFYHQCKILTGMKIAKLPKRENTRM